MQVPSFRTILACFLMLAALAATTQCVSACASMPQGQCPHHQTPQLTAHPCVWAVPTPALAMAPAPALPVPAPRLSERPQPEPGPPAWHALSAPSILRI
jgi:hypothetical protein